MGEYLELISKRRMKDSEIRQIVDDYFKKYQNLKRELLVSNGKIETKLATCEEVFFTFEEMVKLHKFIKKYSDLFQYGKRHDYNNTVEDILNYRGSLYLGNFHRRQDRKGVKKVAVPSTVSKKIGHYDVWRRTVRTISKTGKVYWKRIKKSDCFNYGNPNGKQIDCPNRDKTFTAPITGFAWDCKNNKGRTLYNCSRCKCTFNMGEEKTREFAWLAKELNKENVGVEA